MCASYTTFVACRWRNDCGFLNALSTLPGNIPVKQREFFAPYHNVAAISFWAGLRAVVQDDDMLNNMFRKSVEACKKIHPHYEKQYGTFFLANDGWLLKPEKNNAMQKVRLIKMGSNINWKD